MDGTFDIGSLVQIQRLGSAKGRELNGKLAVVCGLAYKSSPSTPERIPLRVFPSGSAHSHTYANISVAKVLKKRIPMRGDARFDEYCEQVQQEALYHVNDGSTAVALKLMEALRGAYGRDVPLPIDGLYGMTLSANNEHKKGIEYMLPFVRYQIRTRPNDEQTAMQLRQLIKAVCFSNETDPGFTLDLLAQLDKTNNNMEITNQKNDMLQMIAAKMSQTRHVKEQQVYKQLVKIDPYNAMALYHLGIFACRDGNFDFAIALFKKALKSGVGLEGEGRRALQQALEAVENNSVDDSGKRIIPPFPSGVMQIQSLGGLSNDLNVGRKSCCSNGSCR